MAPMSRTVLYAEVPDFYASIERADDPTLARRPVVVGGDPRKRGSVQSASADARAAGVTLEMPMIDALQLCPEARARPTNMGRYREVSRHLHAWLRRGFERLEPSGLAAAFFDVSGAAEAPRRIAERLRARVAEELGLPLRVGIASGRSTARLAAEEAGDDGILEIPPGGERAFLAPLNVTRLEGVGEKTAARLAELGARCIGEIAGVDRDALQDVLGTHGLRILALAAGLDDRPVRGTRHPKTLSRESTLGEPTRDVAVLADHLQDVVQQLAAELALLGLAAGRLALKLRFADQAVTSRSLTFARATAAAGELGRAAAELLKRTDAGARPVRSLRLQLAGLVLEGAGDAQLDLFPPAS
jgi:DNA polymerase-4